MSVLRARLRSFSSCSSQRAAGLTPAQQSRSPAKVLQKAPRKPKPVKPITLPAGVPRTELFLELADRGVAAIARRPTLVNEDAARDLVREWGVDKLHDAVVIEPFAGPGGITRALLELKNVKRVISIEDSLRYNYHLRLLKDRQDDPARLALIDHDPFSWEAYTKAQEQGLLDDVPKHPWEEVHPNLFLACQLPNNRMGEQIFVQFIHAIAGRMWYYQYGRMEMGFTGATAYFKKILSPAGSASHHKLAVLTPALATMREIDLLGGLYPPERFFHKPRGDPGNFGIVKITPHVAPIVKNFDALEFVTRNMFISRTQSWRKGVTGLAPGAGNLIPLMEAAGINKGDIAVRDLTLADWTVIADVFEAWPFRPQTLFDEGEFTPPT